MTATWRTWRSGGGGYWATRMGDLTDADLANGLEMTLAADSADELQNKIAQQAVLLKIAEMAHPQPADLREGTRR